MIIVPTMSNSWVETLPTACGMTNAASQVLQPFVASPALDPVTGNVYIDTTSTTANKNWIFALGASNLQLLWSNNIFNSNVVNPQDPSTEWTGSPAVGTYGGNRSIFVGSITETLFSFNQNGGANWQFNLGAHTAEYSTPAIAGNGTVYAAVDETMGDRSPPPSFSGILSINPTNGANATTNWGFTPQDVHGPATANLDNGGDIDSSPILAGNGDALFLAEGWRFHRVSPTGDLLWFTPVPGDAEPDSTPALDAQGHIYVGSNSRLFYAFNPDGSIYWIFDTGGSVVQSAPAIDASGVVYIANDSGHLFAVSNSVVLWEFVEPNGFNFKSSPAVDKNGVVYIGSSSPLTTSQGFVYAIQNGVMQWADNTTEGVLSSPTISSNGNIYVGGSDGRVHVYSGAPVDTNAPWPMFRKDAVHSGQQTPITTSDSDCGAPCPYDGMLTSNQFSFTIVGRTNLNPKWNIYSSTNLSSWTAVKTGLTFTQYDNATYGTNSFTDTTVSNVSQRFYIVSTNGCCSRIIGFIKVPVAPGTNLIADQLCQVDDGELITNANWAMNTLNGLFNNTFTSQQNNAAVFAWNGSAFTKYTFASSGLRWIDSSNKTNFSATILPGAGVLFDNVTTNTYTLTFIGLLRQQQIVQVNPGTNYLSATFPLSGAITNVTAYAPQTGDIVRLWNTNSQTFSSYTNGSGGWSPTVPTTSAGQGFVLITSNAYTWTNTWSQNCP
jgi:outer membrane protein assembly factor BamB